MALPRTTIPANAVRTPAVEEGTITVVSRYQDSNVKVALVHPADLEALEAAYDRLVEDPREIEALLGL